MNTNIALNARGVQLPRRNAAEPYQQANALMSLQANKQQMALAAQEAQIRNSMLSGLAGASDNNQRAEVLMRHGDIEGATKLQKHGSDMKAANRKAMMETHELVGQLASGVTNQAEWDRVAPQIEALTGEKLSEAERLFSPGTIDALVNMGISAKDARELANQDRNYQLNVDKLGETSRHNRAMEAKDTSTNVEVNVGDANKWNEEFAKGAAKKLLDHQTAAEDAVIGLGTLNEAKKLLDEGMITGAGANPLMMLGKVAKQLGLSDSEAAINSDTFGALMAAEVANRIKAFGSGTGLSDKDREFATKAAAGEISMDGNSIRRIISINEKVYNAAIDRYNKGVERFQSGQAAVPHAIEAPKAPSSIDPATQQMLEQLQAQFPDAVFEIEE